MATAEIDLAALRANLALLTARLAPGCGVMAAVKADAYGHGAVRIAAALAAAGVEWFAVATPEEALELRTGGITGRVLLLGPAFELIPELVDADVDLTITDDVSLEALVGARAARPARVHLKVDTGMGRLGLPPAEALPLARRLDRAAGVRLEGVWTHFARAEEADPTPTCRQFEEFQAFRSALARDGIEVPLAHASNSAGLLAHREAHLDLVRPGLALYGYPPGPSPAVAAPGLEPILTLTAPVTFVKRVPPGTPIAYGATWHAPRATTIATVRCGYADGYPRLLGNRAWASLRGQRAAVVGRVCMDQLLLDVGNSGAAHGERAALLGGGGPDAAELAELAGTIPYEILTSLSRRVERTYRDEGGRLSP